MFLLSAVEATCFYISILWSSFTCVPHLLGLLVLDRIEEPLEQKYHHGYILPVVSEPSITVNRLVYNNQLKTVFRILTLFGRQKILDERCDEYFTEKYKLQIPGQ